MIEQFTEFDPSSGCVRDLYTSTPADMVVHCEARKTAFISGHAPSNCLYVKHTENGWEFDPDRLPEPPETGCVWEYPRWVTLDEQRDRYNKVYEDKLSSLDRKKIRTLSELSINNQDQAAIKRLQDYEAEAVELRKNLWRSDKSTPPKTGD